MSVKPLSLVVLFVLLLVLPAVAQHADLAVTGEARPSLIPERAFGYLNALDTRIVRKFKRNYPLALQERWSMGADCVRATFGDRGRHVMVDYDRKGMWRDTYTIMNEAQMPADVRWLIKSNFIDDRILTVTRVEGTNIDEYFVRTELRTRSKLIRVAQNGFEVVQEFNQSPAAAGK